MNATQSPMSPESETSSFGKGREQTHRNMMAAVAHDLMTPLASIIGSLEVFMIMKEKLSAEKQAELIGVALKEAHRLESFITNILDMAKLENGVLKPRQDKVDISVMLSRCLAQIENQAQGAILTVHGNAGSISTTTDEALLSRVVGLVLDNAVKYGGYPPNIQIEFGKNDLCYISIRDNGDGIPDNQLDNIFSKYTRLERTGKQKVPGAGLGLAIARPIMELLKGSITAINHSDGGAVFTIRFPAR